MITDSERSFALRQLDQSKERLLRVLDGLSPEQLLYRPDSGRWSVAENIEHVAVVEKRVAEFLEKLVQEPPDFAKQSLICDAEVVWRGSTVVEPLQAPERVLPTLRWPLETLRHEFESVRQSTRDFAGTTTGDLRRHFLAHPLFGELDCFQWLLLVGAHCNRHASQSEAIRNSRNFPD